MSELAIIYRIKNQLCQFFNNLQPVTGLKVSFPSCYLSTRSFYLTFVFGPLMELADLRIDAFF